jgi:predicted O-methyltransferase YrrM
MLFTQNWSASLPISLNTAFPTPPTGPMTCVEIGCFEGRGSLILVEKLCSHPASVLYCIDPWNDAYVFGNEDFQAKNPMFVGQWGRFKENTAHEPKIRFLRGTSDARIPDLSSNSINFALIDGDHSPEQVYKDAAGLWPKLKQGSIVIFDDYKWEYNGVRTAAGIDRFLAEHAGSLEVLHKDWQVIFKVLVTPSSSP